MTNAKKIKSLIYTEYMTKQRLRKLGVKEVPRY